MLLCVSLLPESPRWLLRRGNPTAARRALAISRGVRSRPQTVAPEFSELEAAIESELRADATPGHATGWATLAEPQIRRLLGVCVALASHASALPRLIAPAQQPPGCARHAEAAAGENEARNEQGAHDGGRHLKDVLGRGCSGDLIVCHSRFCVTDRSAWYGKGPRPSRRL